MTRFWITLQEGVDFVLINFERMFGGEIFVPKIDSINIKDLVPAFNPKAKIKITGIRPGEKLHEQMIGPEDALYTYEYPGHYKILPSINKWSKDPKRIGNGKLVEDGFIYNSKNNLEWMSKDKLSMWIKEFVNK